MRRFGLATLIVAFFALVFTFIPKSAWTQGVVQLCYYTNTFVCQVVSVANPLPVNASVSASISGFTAATTGTPISVTTSNSTGTLPAGAVVVATNVGATNAAYCALGAAATTSSQYLSPGGGWFAFTVGASTQLTCITSSSTTTVNMTGGTGLPTGTGGGGGALLPLTTTQAKVTIAVTSTYQQALASSGTRKGCLLQNNGTHTAYVFFGSAPADTTTSWQLGAGQSINCAVGGSGVATDAIQVTGTAADVIVVSSQ